METKQCSDCKQIISLQLFQPCNVVKSGYSNLCKDCHKIRRKKYRVNDFYAKLKAKEKQKEARKNLDDLYIKAFIQSNLSRKGISIKIAEIPEELVTAKRIALKFYRDFNINLFSKQKTPLDELYERTRKRVKFLYANRTEDQKIKDSEEMHKYYLRNKDKIKQRTKAWSLANPERAKEYKRKYRLKQKLKNLETIDFKGV